MPYSLALLSTHPIQYHTPWYQALSQHPDIDLTVYFCHKATEQEQAAAGFGVNFNWDVPLLEGYAYEFLPNVAATPSTRTFSGLDNPVIAKYIADKRFDAVLVSGWTYKTAWRAFMACWRHRIPVMVRGDSHLHTQRSALKRIAKYPFYRAFLTRMSAALAVGTWSSDYYAHYGVPHDHIFIVPHVVDEARFISASAAAHTRRAELRHQWGIPEDAVVFLFCGKLIDKKRPLDFIQAILRARQIHPHITGLVVGDGPLRQQAELLAGLTNGIVFAGFQNQSHLPKFYGISDVVLLPSNAEETWGLVVNEAMLCGLPAIVSDQVGCGPDLIVEGETGSIFPMGDVQRLADLMVNYAQDASWVRLMGQKAQSNILTNFGVAQAVDGVLQALDRVSTQ